MRKAIYAIVAIVFVILLITAGAALLVRNDGEPDFQATQEASVTECADLYPAGSAAYKACIETQ